MDREDRKFFYQWNLFATGGKLNRWMMAFMLCGLILISFCIRFFRATIDYRMEKDAVCYIWIAEAFYESGFDRAFELNPRIPPMYIFLIVGLMKLGIGAEYAGLLISLISGSLLVIPVFFIGKYIFRSFEGAMLSALLCVMHPNLARVSAQVLRDPLYLLFFSISVWMFIEGIKRMKWWYFAVAGAVGVLSAATRSEGVDIVIGVLIYLIVEIVLHFWRRDNDRERIKKLLYFSLVFFISYGAVGGLFEYICSFSSSCEWHLVDWRIFSYLSNFLSEGKG